MKTASLFEDLETSIKAGIPKEANHFAEILVEDFCVATHKFLTGLLNTYSIHITFRRKKDGAARGGIFTTNLDKIPVEHHPKDNSAFNYPLVTVYDLEEKGWRSFDMYMLINYTIKEDK